MFCIFSILQMKVLSHKVWSIYIGQLLHRHIVEVGRHLALISNVLLCASCVVGVEHIRCSPQCISVIVWWSLYIATQ